MTHYLNYWDLFLYDGADEHQKLMVFVDGENLSIRYKEISKGLKIPGSTKFREDIYVWSDILNSVCIKNFNVIRKYYYTSIKGDTLKIDQIHNELKELKIEAPRVFKKTKDHRSKQVDISLATDMLIHATRKNYDVALLVAGDEDYIPLVQAVQSEGCKVYCWFVKDGISNKLIKECDYYFDISDILISNDIKIAF